MMVKLSGGVVPRTDRQAWIQGPAGRPVDATAGDLPPGTPVAVGSRSVRVEAVGRALAELAGLVAAGGPIAAGADVDLGHGLRSARTEGGAGDRRDAVLAALRVPGFGDRLGDRAAILVALFGPEATKPLGAAAQQAVDEGHWAQLRFAAAASDLLGPEQLVQLLALEAPDGVDPFAEGLPSVVGAHLARVLRTVSRPRRMELLTALWHQVCAAGSARLRLARLRASQGRQNRSGDLYARYTRYEEDELRSLLKWELGGEPTVISAALWQPSAGYWLTRATRVLRDAMAATVLTRLASAAADHPVEEALVLHWHEIEAGAAELPKHEASLSARVVAGLTGLPARPGSYLRDIRDRVRPGEPLDARRTAYVTQRLAHARDYGWVALRAVGSLIAQAAHEDAASMRDNLAAWAADTLGVYRGRVGYFSPQRLGVWDQQPPLGGDDQTRTLAQRLAAESHRPPAEIETIGDFFWYAELADALAPLYGHPAAVFYPHSRVLAMDVRPPEPDEPLVPRPDSIVLAAAGTAQLAELGGQVPRRCRTWAELVAGLLASAAVAEALTGAFTLPPALAAADGTVLPGTDVRIEVARTGRQLADWSDYMGNCLAGTYYLDAAAAGRTALVALRMPDGRIVANAQLRPTAHGWRLEEIKARFNDDPEPQLLRHTRAWAAALPLPQPPIARPADLEPERPPRARSSTPAARIARDLGGPLGDLVAAATAQPATARAAATLAALAARLDAAPAQPAADLHLALTALRRATPSGLVRAMRLTLSDVAGPGLMDLWSATGDRPLSRAVAALPPSDENRLGRLLEDAPLPGSLRTLARLPNVAPAHTAELVALRVRTALGTLLRQDAPELARAVFTRPYAPFIRAAALTVTSRGGLGPVDHRATAPPTGAVTVVSPRRRVQVPGFPQSSLKDESWQAAWPDAIELGASPDGFWDHITAHGLLLPSSWLSGGGWPTLWSRAARHPPTP